MRKQWAHLIPFFQSHEKQNPALYTKTSLTTIVWTITTIALEYILNIVLIQNVFF